MKIIGGIYREICLDPDSDHLFGSGLRATLAISRGCKELFLFGYAEAEIAKVIKSMSEKFGFKTEIRRRQNEIGFVYDTPISSPKVFGLDEKNEPYPTLTVSGKNILAFSIMESSIDVKADRLVIDPQGASKFEGNIKWSAKHLAIVANKKEIKKLLEITDELSVDLLAEKARVKFQAEVVVVKCGALGAVLSDSGKITHIDAYITSRVNPIGSGDVFSGVFAYYWGELGTSSEVASINASKATAEWVRNGPLQVITHNSSVMAPNAQSKIFGNYSRIYLAAPFFTVSERWLVNLCRDALTDLGGTVFSPLHDVGKGKAEVVVPQDLEGLSKSKSILALLDGMDPGTLFEVGYGASRGKEIVVFMSDEKGVNLTMFRGIRAHIHHNLASAIYEAIWFGTESTGSSETSTTEYEGKSMKNVRRLDSNQVNIV